MKFFKLIIVVVPMLLFFYSSKAQNSTLVQVRTFNQRLETVPNVEFSLNNQEFYTTESDGLLITEIPNNLLPPKAIYLRANGLEAESWNYSKGVLEIIVREKTFELYTFKVVNRSGIPQTGQRVRLNSSSPLEKTTDGNGNVLFPIPLDLDASNEELFSIPDHTIASVRINGLNGTLTADPIPIPVARTIESPSSKPLAELDLSSLNSINSLTAFYAFVRGINMNDLSERQKQQIDAVFQRIVRDLETPVVTDPFLLDQISDSSLVARDIQLLTEQARQEGILMDEANQEIFENLGITAEKLQQGGGANLTEEERLNLLANLDLLERLLDMNRTKFTESQADFAESIAQLKSGLMSIKELEERMSAEREAERKAFNKRLLIAFGVTVGLALLAGLMIFLTGKYNKQKKALTKANAEINRMNENLEGLVAQKTRSLRMVNKELDTFLYKSSHDLKRPLTSIIGLANIAKMTMDEQSYELFDRARETADDMNKLLLKLQMVSHINNPSEFSEVNLEEVIEEVSEEFKEYRDKYHIHTDYEYCDDLTLVTYPVILRIIFRNLLENAFFFSVVGGKDPSVSVSVSKNSTSFVVKIRDNGEGISKEMRKDVWNMFFVGHEKSKGNGLGLYIANKAIKALNGQLAYSTRVGKYTEFKIQIPHGLNGKAVRPVSNAQLSEIAELAAT